MLKLESCFYLGLVDTVYVPSMKRNLISFSRFDNHGYFFAFGSGLVLRFKSHIIGTGDLNGGFYRLALISMFLFTLNLISLVMHYDIEY